MKTTTRVARAMAVLAFAGSTLLAGASMANAAAPAALRAEAALPTPHVISATVSTEIAAFVWEPVDETNVVKYAVYADGKLAVKYPAPSTWTSVWLPYVGLTGKEVFTIRAEDSAGNQSAPSNGVVPVPAAVNSLPTPTLASAVLDGGTVRLTWTPSRTEYAGCRLDYTVRADGVPIAGAYDSATATSFPLVDPGLLYELTGNETFTVSAVDCSLATSSQSNGLKLS